MAFDCCPLTGWKIINNQYVNYYMYFRVHNGVKEFSYLINRDLLTDPTLRQNQHIFRWILLNNLFFDNVSSISDEQLRLYPHKYGIDKKQYQIYVENYSKISPKAKMNHFLVSLFDHCKDSFSVKKSIFDYILISSFKNESELDLYVDELVDNELILKKILAYPEVIEIKFTFKGLLKVATLNESGNNSKRCFIAMSFDESLRETREAIRTAIGEAGYDAIFIDEVYPESDQTINDAIIAEIKRSKFLVADFTQQKNGVYFEAGYALGRGLKVIYCCDKEDFKKSHFDLKPFSHILYNSAEELQKRLKYKIEAWIE